MNLNNQESVSSSSNPPEHCIKYSWENELITHIESRTSLKLIDPFNRGKSINYEKERVDYKYEGMSNGIHSAIELIMSLEDVILLRQISVHKNSDREGYYKDYYHTSTYNSYKEFKGKQADYIRKDVECITIHGLKRHRFVNINIKEKTISFSFDLFDNEAIYLITSWFPTGGTGEVKLQLRNQKVLCSSISRVEFVDLSVPHFSPICSYDFINEYRLIGYPCFDLNEITLVPGRKLSYEIFGDDDFSKSFSKKNKIADFEKVLSRVSLSFQTATYQSISDDIVFQLEKQSDESISISAMGKEIAVIEPDKDFKCNSRNPVDKQSILRIDSDYDRLLPYIFHALLLF